ncbi:MAG TPA: GAF domain-containing protein [Ktedonobacteraceae bacterium]|jgi:hypothetical protein|nr:GAF domain-containing protein [Ktedonobacteraceae bacterium]
MQDYQTWRDLLSDLIKNPRQRKKIARAVEIDTETLVAWAQHTGTPSHQQLHMLLQAVPQRQMLLRTLIEEEFDAFADDRIDELPHIASIALSARVLELYASAPDESRFWSICTAVLAEAVKQLDPDGLGISLSIVQCMPSEDKTVSCLREYIALGTSPWLNQIEIRTRFLGAESLAGQAVSSGQQQIIEEINPGQRLMSNTPEHVVSAAAFPIMHSKRIAGCFLLASTQAGYFSAQARQELMQNYNAMLPLAFPPRDFYNLEQIALRVMPTFEVQQPYLSTFQQRIMATLKTAFTANRAISYPEAQQHVYGQIAKELLQLHS